MWQRYTQNENKATKSVHKGVSVAETKELMWWLLWVILLYIFFTQLQFILKTEKLYYVTSYLGIELVKYKKISLTYLHILYVCLSQMPNDYT